MGKEATVKQLSTEHDGKDSSAKTYEPPTVAFETIFKDLHVTDFGLQKKAEFSSTIAQALTIPLETVNFILLPTT